MATASATNLEVELAELRFRLRSTLHDPARPICEKMSDFRTLLHESRRCGATVANPQPHLDDSL
ncbi:MAG TPA: hypothetical protein VHU89_18165 [Acidobacteriaceae bacterium]|jgi:hypothetical protein|nr:hypothetical protein [Acidobacteriaceae bacterium]